MYKNILALLISLSLLTSFSPRSISGSPDLTPASLPTMKPGDILVSEVGLIDVSSKNVLFHIDPTTGIRTQISDFRDETQGQVLQVTRGLGVDTAGNIMVTGYGGAEPRYVALYEPANIDIHVGGRLFYGWCDGECSAGNPFQLVQVASGEGPSVDLEIDHQGRSHLVYDAGQRGVLGHLWCDSNCTNADSWQRRILTTNEQLMADFAPAIPFTCDQQVAHAWLDAIPALTFDSTGKLVVAYDVKHVATCYYQDPAKPDPIITRVERIWWAVRWDYFAQP